MIQAREIRVIDDDKKQLGVMSPAEALALARQKGMDLVEIAPQAVPPVCRVMDYGKFLYEVHKKDHEAKKHQKQIHLKEIKFRPKISIHDYTFKMKHVLRFLGEGDKVKITVMLRGRERSRPGAGAGPPPARSWASRSCRGSWTRPRTTDARMERHAGRTGPFPRCWFR
jgi:translation initiation factor IF-3